MKQILLISRIKVHNANALSSPYTIGFPAMTAWLGTVHALQRKLNHAEFHTVVFKSVAVVCHDIDLQIFRGKGDFVNGGMHLTPPTTRCSCCYCGLYRSFFLFETVAHRHALQDI